MATSNTTLVPIVKVFTTNSTNTLTYSSAVTLSNWIFLEVNVTGTSVNLSINNVALNIALNVAFALNNNLTDFVLANNTNSDTFR